MKRSIKAGEFKAECLKIMDQVKKTRKKVIITKRNVPVAQLVPMDMDIERPIFGCMKGTIEITGDIVKPTGEKWDVFD
ncbi:MAG: type II toxin-antitoxin system prevent-host-death family antitoxin [Simkaniaceae bacterium]|nr:type II toxin-antitoxin system prevent-host-death family antitoxin [Candidatus Sacchlamyda saccharinae]